MASNFWTSTHANHHLHPRSAVNLSREYDRRHVSLDELTYLEMWLADAMYLLGARLGMRQRIIATGQTFMKRLFMRNAYAEIEPTLAIPACLYVAAKVEEAPVHVKTVFQETQEFWREAGIGAGRLRRPSDIAEMEFYLIEELDFHLVVHQPHTAMLQLMGIPIDSEEVAHKSLVSPVFPSAVVEMTWALINDSYKTPVCLIYPPHAIALACLCVAAGQTTSEKSMGDFFAQFFASLDMDMAHFLEIVQDLVSMLQYTAALRMSKQGVSSNETASRILHKLRRGWFADGGVYE